MRLINTKTFDLEEYFGKNIPKYAILSHSWYVAECICPQTQQPVDLPCVVGEVKRSRI